MKNRWFYLLFTCLSCFFLVSFSHASLLEYDGGQEGMIVISKTGDVVCSFEIPKQYVNQEGNSTVPINVSIYQNGKKAIYSAESSFDIEPIMLPEISGTYTVTMTIGNYQEKYVHKE